MHQAIRISLLVLLLWSMGLVTFVANIPRETDPELHMRLAEVTRSDTGIIALTGGGGKRIEAAIALYEGNNGEKVLISGVHPDATKSQLARYVRGTDHIFDCCIDLGQKAQTTKGNAVEAREWMAENSLKRAIIVTTDYHMLRAMAEIRASMPGATLIAYPVPSDTAPAENWYLSPSAIRILSTEYMKYVAVRAGQLLGLD